jgi:hypothetical protein
MIVWLYNRNQITYYGDIGQQVQNTKFQIIVPLILFAKYRISSNTMIKKKNDNILMSFWLSYNIYMAAIK